MSGQAGVDALKAAAVGSSLNKVDDIYAKSAANIEEFTYTLEDKITNFTIDVKPPAARPVGSAVTPP